MKQQYQQKMYIIRKYVMSVDVAGALKKEKHIKPHEIFVDEDWRKNAKDRLADAIGFIMPPPEDSEQ